MFSAGMWQILQDNLNDGVVNQVCAARIYSTSNFPTNATLAAISFNTERYDGDTMHTSGSPTQLVCNTAGVYSIGGSVEWPTDAAAGRVYLAIMLNGTTVIAKDGRIANAGGNMPQQVSCDFYLNALDYVELYAASLSDLTIQANSDYSPEFWMHRV